jgi:hypothetical protein
MSPRRRRLGVAASVLLAVVTAAVVAWRLSGGGDTARDIGARLDLVDEGPFELRLGGALWESRTLLDHDGAPDIAYVAGDEALTVDITGRGGRRPAAVDVRVDGRSAARRALCDAGACPRHARLTVAAPVAERGAGPHSVTVIARGETGGDTARASFEVTVVERLPTVREGEPVAGRATGARPPPIDPGQRQRTLSVIDRERRSGVLRDVLGRTAYTVAAIGELEHGPRRVGTTILLRLARARRSVTSDVPGYRPDPGPAGYRLGVITLSAPVLRDLLVDVDLARGRVIAVEPGPDSRTDGWDTRDASSPTGSKDED